MTGENEVRETSFPAATDAGMHALWNPARFTHIVDYESWEGALLEDEDITRRVSEGGLVPINVGGDGAFQFLVRVGTTGQSAALTSRERQCLLVSSQPYLYLSDGIAHITGIERIGADPGPAVSALPVPVGSNAVTIHLIYWDAEPGSKDEDGKPSAGPLPDFVVLINPAAAEESVYRTQLQTFDRG